MLTENLLEIAIFNTSYFRGLFPEKYFNDKSVPALEKKFKKLMPVATESCRLIDCIGEAVYDALQKKYLKTLLICVCEAIDGPMIEEYAFSFSYSTSDSQEVSMNINRNGNKKAGTVKCSSTTDITPDQMRSSACKMVRTLVQLMRTMDKMPNERIILMKLFYYEDVTPADYEPPFLQGCSEEESKNPWTITPLKMEVGNIHNKHFVLALKVKSVPDPREDKNDENQDNLSLPVYSALRDEDISSDSLASNSDDDCFVVALAGKQQEKDNNALVDDENTQDPLEDEQQFIRVKDRISSHNGGILPNYNPLESREACKDRKDTNKIIVQAQSSAKSAAAAPLHASHYGQHTGSLNQSIMASISLSSSGSNVSVEAEQAAYEHQSCRSLTSIVAMIDNEGVVMAVDSRESEVRGAKVVPVNEKRQKLIKVYPTVFLAGTGLCLVIDYIEAEISKRPPRIDAKNIDMDGIAELVKDKLINICRQRRVDLGKEENGVDFVLIGTIKNSAGIYALRTVEGSFKVEKSGDAFITLRSGPNVKKFITLGSGTPAMKQYLEKNKDVKFSLDMSAVDFCVNCIEDAANEDKHKTGGKYIHVVHLLKGEPSSSHDSRDRKKPKCEPSSHHDSRNPKKVIGYRYSYLQKDYPEKCEKKTYVLQHTHELKNS